VTLAGINVEKDGATWSAKPANTATSMAAHLSAPKSAKITAKTVVNATMTFPLSQIHAGNNVTMECAMRTVWTALMVKENAKECAKNTVLTVENAE